MYDQTKLPRLYIYSLLILYFIDKLLVRLVYSLFPRFPSKNFRMASNPIVTLKQLFFFVVTLANDLPDAKSNSGFPVFPVQN